MTSPRAEVLAATPTMFTADGDLDEKANQTLLEHLEPLLDGVFVAGTTGEFPALTAPERSWLAARALETFGPDRVVVHVGAAATRDAAALARDAVALGARRLAVVTPYYLAADEAVTTAHLAQVAAAAREAGPAVEVYGYVFAERTGVALEPDAFARVAAGAGLTGAKLSGAAGTRVADYVAAVPSAVRIWSGADVTLAASTRAGGAGVVSALSGVFPAPFTALADAVAAGDATAEADAQRRVDAVAAAVAGGIATVKAALAAQGLGTPTVRMPHARVPTGLAARLTALG